MWVTFYRTKIHLNSQMIVKLSNRNERRYKYFAGVIFSIMAILDVFRSTQPMALLEKSIKAYCF